MEQDKIKLLQELTPEPMTEELTRMFINATMLELKSVGAVDEQKLHELAGGQELGEALMAAIILLRRVANAPAPGLQLTLGVLLTLVFAAAGNPGKLVYYAYSLFQRRKGQLVTMAVLADEFPFGFPKDAEFKQAWEEQKDGGTNRLDHYENW